MRKKSHQPVGLTVEVYNGNFDQALRKFKKKVQKAGRIQEIRDRQYYEKPSETKQRKKAEAKRRTRQQVIQSNPLRKRR